MTFPSITTRSPSSLSPRAEIFDSVGGDPSRPLESGTHPLETAPAGGDGGIQSLVQLERQMAPLRCSPHSLPPSDSERIEGHPPLLSASQSSNASSTELSEGWSLSQDEIESSEDFLARMREILRLQSNVLDRVREDLSSAGDDLTRLDDAHTHLTQTATAGLRSLLALDLPMRSVSDPGEVDPGEMDPGETAGVPESPASLSIETPSHRSSSVSLEEQNPDSLSCVSGSDALDEESIRSQSLPQESVAPDSPSPNALAPALPASPPSDAGSPAAAPTPQPSPSAPPARRAAAPTARPRSQTGWFAAVRGFWVGVGNQLGRLVRWLFSSLWRGR